MAEERLVSMPTAWGENAQTNIPTPPIPNIAYRDEALTADQIAAGQSYAALLESSGYNEFLYRLSKLLQLLEQNGILPWSQKTNYQTGALTLGLDGIVYQALEPSGPASQPVEPPSPTYWRVGIGQSGGGVINLVAISATAPSGTFTEDDKYYNSTSKQIFTYISGTWDEPETPASNVIYENSQRLYVWSGSELTAAPPDATTAIKGIMAFATNAEAAAGAVTDKALTPAQAKTYYSGGAATVTTTWKSSDGLSWYRKWSDGFIEQGGIGSNGGTGATVTLPTSFTTVNYVALIARISDSSSTSMGGQAIRTKATTSFVFNLGHSDARAYNWYACGY